MSDDQQFCLRWNNFQANITSQFETLRDDEDFTDVTIACEGQRIQAHKVVLSACSPFFKELFKTNPCSHPIIFMRDVEARHVASLMEFMYAGQVNVAQAHLSTFLKTAESLKIRGLTDTSENFLNRETETLCLNPQRKIPLNAEKSQISSTNNVTSSQDVPDIQNVSSPPPKKSKSDVDVGNQQTDSGRHFGIRDSGENGKSENHLWQPKDEMPDYLSDVDEDDRVNDELTKFPKAAELTELPGNMEIFSRPSLYCNKDISQEPLAQGLRRISDYFTSNAATKPHHHGLDDVGETITLHGPKYEGETKSRLVKLADGIEIYEDQLRSVKWSDYRKLTRGLATILFSPAELATCSVTGQRWSRAGSVERPVKPALDRAKVQAIISYVATRFPMVEVSRIKQVLAYKCKENSTALKMKAVRQYSDSAISQWN